jgi:copper chaperone
LNALEGVESWKVDTENPSKILTVDAENTTAEVIIETIEDLGFDIEKV